MEIVVNRWKKKVSGGPPSLVSVEPSPSTTTAAAKSRFGKVVRHLVKHLSINDILNCRLVCHSWMIAVDHLLEDSLSIPPLPTTPSTSKARKNARSKTSVVFQPQPDLFHNCRIHSSFMGPHILEGIHLLDTETLKLFLERMETHERNPFLGRCVRFGNYGDTKHNAAYWDNCLELLRQFGLHIWYVELSDGHVSVPNPLTCYRLVRQCLMQLPSLRSLEISFANQNIGRDKVAELIHFMLVNPLPPLKMLDKLEWNEQSCSELVQDNVLTAYSKQLNAFACPISVFVDKNKPYSFPNLRHLYITNVMSNEVLSSLLAWKLPNLKILYLNLGSERCRDCGTLCNETWSSKIVLEIVKKFQLEFLSLFLAPGGKLAADNTDLKSAKEWKINSMKCFEVQHCQENQYDFLKCFKALERIHFYDIHHPAFPERGTSEGDRASVSGSIESGNSGTLADALDIQKFLYDRKMEESNIWELIPSLKEVTFKCTWDRDGANLIELQDLYTREAWDKRRSTRMAGAMSRVVAFVKSMFSFSFTFVKSI